MAYQTKIRIGDGTKVGEAMFKRMIVILHHGF